ncbi:hypothetical protein [Curtobacterium luteum]|uniref:hypothetical protein n=1 Tax=Curtobacterium luteum TaxID=33881 RepID=UPI0038181B8A
MKNLWPFAVAGLAFLVSGVVLIVNGSAGSLVFGIPLLLIGLVCVVLAAMYRRKSVR